MNHDARFKLLMKTHSVLQGFFQEFLPETARFVDFRSIEFVDKELFSLDGKKRTGDLLIKTRFATGSDRRIWHEISNLAR